MLEKETTMELLVYYKSIAIFQQQDNHYFHIVVQYCTSILMHDPANLYGPMCRGGIVINGALHFSRYYAHIKAHRQQMLQSENFLMKKNQLYRHKSHSILSPMSYKFLLHGLVDPF